MAYQIPPRWSHGDKPTAALMNKYSDALNAINDVMGEQVAYAVPLFPSVGGASKPIQVWVIHRWRYLHYSTLASATATIVDPSGTNDAITIPASDSAIVSYDLSGVSWLSQGQAYYVVGCDMVAEDYEG